MWKWVLFLLFCAFVALETAVLMQVGSRLGVGWTLLWMLGSSVAGLLAVRIAGLQALVRIHHKLRAQELPTEELLDMALILLGGVLLIAPGFVSDAMGVLLLLRPVRWVVRGMFRAVYGELLPPAHPAPRPGAPMDDAIEIRARD
jgi:UPF0716 protein FxsA